MGDSILFSVNEIETGRRLDQILAKRLSDRDFSRSQIQMWIKQGFVRINDRVVLKPKTEVCENDAISVEVPPPESTELQAEEMALPVIFEDDDLIVIDKPSGIVVHPGSGNPNGTVVNGLLHHCRGKLSELADEGRPGIVHRLDKETSGCLVAAKSDVAYQSLVEQFSERKTKKQYVAIANGHPMELQGRIETQIGRHPVNRQRMAIVEPPAGKIAITEYSIRHAAADQSWSWIDCRILTGRTHQIRVHLKEALHCPILGDPIYAKPNRQSRQVKRLLLHAWKLTIQHPVSKQVMEFEAPIPDEFDQFSI